MQNLLSISTLARATCRIEGRNKSNTVSTARDASGFHLGNGWILANGKLIDDCDSVAELKFFFPAQNGDPNSTAAVFYSRQRPWMGAPVGAPPILKFTNLASQQDLIDPTVFLFKIGVSKKPSRSRSNSNCYEFNNEQQQQQQLNFAMQTFPYSNSIEDSLEQVMIDRIKTPPLSVFCVSNKHLKGRKSLNVLVVYCNSILEESYADQTVLHCKLENLQFNRCENAFADLSALDGGPLPEGVSGAPVFQECTNGYMCLGYVVERERKGVSGCFLWGERLLAELKTTVAAK